MFNICDCFNSHAFVDVKFSFFFFFCILSDFCLLHVFCVCVCVCVRLGYCSQLVLWLLSLDLCVNTARETVSLALFFCICCRILTLNVIMPSGGAGAWFNTQPFFLRAQTTNDVVLDAVTMPIRIEFQWDRLRLWASGDAFYPKVGKYVSCWRTRVLSVSSCSYLFLLIYSVKQSASWEANRSSASQEISRILWNPEVHFRFDKGPPPVHILQRISPRRCEMFRNTAGF